MTVDPLYLRPSWRTDLGICYFSEALAREQLPLTLSEAVETLQKVGEFGHIAVSGNSGVLFGGVLGYAMNKQLVIVRKPGVDSHGQYQRIEGPSSHDAVQNYIIVDDFICSGETVLRIWGEMSKKYWSSQCLGVYTYNIPARWDAWEALLHGKGWETWMAPSLQEQQRMKNFTTTI